MFWRLSLAIHRWPWSRVGQIASLFAAAVLLVTGARLAARRVGRELALESCRRHGLQACERLCAEGHVESCFQLGEIHAQGRGVAVDPERAMALFETACRGWDRRGCREMGLIHQAGVWRPRNLARAAELLRLACDGPDGAACTALGAMTEMGDGVQGDQRRALGFFERGCRAYDAQGCARAGALLARGEGVPRDLARARPLLDQGCRGGVALGCSGLAELHAVAGAPAGPDDAGAQVLLFVRRACDRGDLEACRTLVDRVPRP